MTLRNHADIRGPAGCHWNFTIRNTRPQETCTHAPNRCTSKGDKSLATESLNNCPGLAPVHSPLLRGSHLVSCLPLIYMLKFSGGPDLESCPNRGVPHRLQLSAAQRSGDALPCQIPTRAVPIYTGRTPPPPFLCPQCVHWPAKSTPKNGRAKAVRAGFMTDADTGKQPSAPRRCGSH